MFKKYIKSKDDDSGIWASDVFRVLFYVKNKQQNKNIKMSKETKQAFKNFKKAMIKNGNM